MSVIRPSQDWQDNRFSQEEVRQSIRERMRIIEEQNNEVKLQSLRELSNKPEPLYLIIQAENIEWLQRQINTLISLGWNLNGGITIAKDTFYQAISKPADVSKSEQPDNHFDSVEFKL